MREKMVVRKRRFYSAHHTLLRIARECVVGAREKRLGWRDDEFVAVVMSCLAIEAICNAFGEKVVDGWGDFESSRPAAKLRVICARLGVDYQKDLDPWKTLRWMQTLRNEIAHPKLEFVEKTESMSLMEYEQRERSAPLSKIEAKITLESAQKSLLAVEKVLEILGEKLSEEDRFDILHDSWEGSGFREQIGP
jgi:hypothetical protein